jgi:DNA excision repair protein ERCC-1
MASNGPTGKPVVLANPYAKKRKFPPITAANHGGVASRPAAPPATSASTSGSADLNPGKMGGGSFSFSQAFGSVEETAHYKNQMTAANNNNNQPPQPDQEGAAAQRALDQQEKVAATMNLQDRDHHILLQPHVLYVSTKQRGNGILKHIRNVPFAYSQMVPDYIMSPTRCALFLSIKYHQLFPNYIHRRLGELKTDFTLRLLLVLVDDSSANHALLFLNTLAVTHNLTLILAWTEQEAARYLETFKALDGKDASLIQKRASTDNFIEQVTDYLTACKPINKTDSQQLLAHFSSIRALAGAASPDELALCPGLGPTKVQRLWDAWHKPFSKRGAKERKKQKEKRKQEEEEAAVVAALGSANGNGGTSANEEVTNNDKKDEVEKENKGNASDGDGDTEQDATKENDKAAKESNGKSGQATSNEDFQLSLAFAEQDDVVDLTSTSKVQPVPNENFQRSLALAEQDDVVDLTLRSRSKPQLAQTASNESFQRSLELAEQDDVVDLTSKSMSKANTVNTRGVTISTISASNFYAKATIATNALLSSQDASTQRAASQTFTKAAPVNPYRSRVVPPASTKPKTTKPKATTRTLTSLLSGVKTTDELLNPTTMTTAKAANSVVSRNLKPPPLPPPAYQKTSNVVTSINSERQEKEQKKLKKRKK